MRTVVPARGSPAIATVPPRTSRDMTSITLIPVSSISAGAPGGEGGPASRRTLQIEDLAADRGLDVTAGAQHGHAGFERVRRRRGDDATDDAVGLPLHDLKRDRAPASVV